MKNYRFSKKIANETTLESLFKVQYALIELQRKANLYLQGVESELSSSGMCGNVEDILANEQNARYVDISELFFRDMAYPIEPYSLSFYSTGEQDKEHRWGKGEVGQRRHAMLARMILDLGTYLAKTDRIE